MTVLERFLKYISISSPSNNGEEVNTQKEISEVLRDELLALGIDVYYDKENCYVYGCLKGNLDAPSIGFISHMDTSLHASGNVEYNLLENYNGEDIVLENGSIIRVKKNSDLLNHIGKTLITTKGDSLLGADDKAGIAEIMTMLERLSVADTPHGDVWVAFTTDEEIGKGTNHFDLDKFKADFAYTIDGSSLGEISYENFNAVEANVTFKGVNVHPGYAKGKMINAVTLTNRFLAMIPKEYPENTEMYEGYYWPCEVDGTVDEMKLKIHLRDFDTQGMKMRIQKLNDIAEYLNNEYGQRVNVVTKERYKNMYEMVKDHLHLVDYAKIAMEDLGITPIVEPARGGTDGANLSFMGIPCPNLGTGGHNFHSVLEYIAVEDMEKVCEILMGIVKNYSLGLDKYYKRFRNKN